MAELRVLLRTGCFLSAEVHKGKGVGSIFAVLVVQNVGCYQRKKGGHRTPDSIQKEDEQAKIE